MIWRINELTLVLKGKEVNLKNVFQNLGDTAEAVFRRKGKFFSEEKVNS